MQSVVSVLVELSLTVLVENLELVEEIWCCLLPPLRNRTNSAKVLVGDSKGTRSSLLNE